MSARILLIEDEVDLARTVAWSLGRDGFTVATAGTGRQGLERLNDEPPWDLVLLDLMLPDMSGTEVCRTIRANPRLRDTLVLMLTARGEEIDRVVGFEVGADDYVVKPFSTRELALRIRAVLRRTLPTPDEGGVLVGGQGDAATTVRLDTEAHRCWVNAEPVQLTATEVKLLARLMSRRGRVQTRAALLDAVWGKNSDVSDRTVDAHVKRLREKLLAGDVHVETVRGVGYRWNDDSSATTASDT